MKWSDILDESVMQHADALERRALDETNAGKKLYPAYENIFRALQITTPDRLKVCVVGQDPYHGPGQANGLAFSVAPGITKPPSLQNIFKELRSDLGVPEPSTGDLTPWAEQGVLLLNTALTVYHKSPDSCADWRWDVFTRAVFEAAMKLPQPVVFMLWGRKAQNFVPGMELTEPVHKYQAFPNKFHVMSSHPSPYSAANGTRAAPAFLGSRPFSTANALLQSCGAVPVDWRLP